MAANSQWFGKEGGKGDGGVGGWCRNAQILATSRNVAHGARGALLGLSTQHVHRGLEAPIICLPIPVA